MQNVVYHGPLLSARCSLSGPTAHRRCLERLRRQALLPHCCRTAATATTWLGRWTFCRFCLQDEEDERGGRKRFKASAFIDDIAGAHRPRLFVSPRCPPWLQ